MGDKSYRIFRGEIWDRAEWSNRGSGIGGKKRIRRKRATGFFVGKQNMGKKE